MKHRFKDIQEVSLKLERFQGVSRRFKKVKTQRVSRSV